MRYQFIKDNLGQFHVAPMCRMLEVSRSAFYDWLNRKQSKRDAGNDELLEKIKGVHALAHHDAYGSRRVHEHLVQKLSVKCSKNRVARVMRENAISAKMKHAFKVTTDSNHIMPVAENILDRAFSVDAPNKAWVADITYIPTYEGWLYLAAVMDLHSRQIVGWSMSQYIDKELVAGALRMAIGRRRPTAGLIIHSDRGVQYASEYYQDLLNEKGMICSMSRKGNCWDNAVMESFFHTLKTECVNHQRYNTRDDARMDIFDYIEVFYNRQRLHSTLGYKTPFQYEQAYAA